jgi:hypothetical protein
VITFAAGDEDAAFAVCCHLRTVQRYLGNPKYQRLPHGAWLPWLRDEFGCSDQTARKFIAVRDGMGKFKPSLNLEIDASALYLLAKPSVPDEVREAAIERATACGASGSRPMG